MKRVGARRQTEDSSVIIAYLDPASGGILIQSLVVAAITIPVVLRNQITRIVGRVRGRRPKN
jgi:hypothetical protein